MSRKKFMATLVYNDQQMKETEDKNALFSLLLPLCLSPLHLYLFKLWPPRAGEKDIMDSALLIQSSFILHSLYWPYPYHPTRWWVPAERRMKTSTSQCKLRDYKQWFQSGSTSNIMLQSKPHFLGATTLLAVIIKSQPVRLRLIKRSY